MLPRKKITSLPHFKYQQGLRKNLHQMTGASQWENRPGLPEDKKTGGLFGRLHHGNP